MLNDSVIGTVTIKPVLRPAILRTFVMGQADSDGCATARVRDEKVLVHMLGGISRDGTCYVEYEDGTLHEARYDRLAFTDGLHDEYDFE